MKLTTDELGITYARMGGYQLPIRRQVPSFCCPYCSKPIGRIGVSLMWLLGAEFHGCDNSNCMHPQEFWNLRELEGGSNG